MTKTHYSYLRDPKTPKRVITVARKVENGVISFGLAICAPYKRTVYSYGHQRVEGDQHEKRIGRAIAEGRMNKAPITVALEKDIHPMVTIAKYLSINAIGFTERTFSAYLKQRFALAASKELEGAMRKTIHTARVC